MHVSADASSDCTFNNPITSGTNFRNLCYDVWFVINNKNFYPMQFQHECPWMLLLWMQFYSSDKAFFQEF